MVIEMTNKEAFSKDFRFVSQIKASSGSGMDNIAEGFERGGNSFKGKPSNPETY